MREANDRGYECLLIEDATESYFAEFKAATIAMIHAQGGIVGWTTPFLIDMTVAMSSTPPEAPRRWPIMLLVLEMASFLA